MNGRPAVVAVTDAKFSAPSTVDVVDLTTGRLAARLWSGDGGMTLLGCAGSLAVLGDAGSIQLWDLDTGRETDRFELPDRGQAVAISPAGDLLVAAGSELVCLAGYRNRGQGSR